MLVLILWGSFQHKRCARQNDVGPYFVRFTSTQKMCLTVEWWSLFCKVHCYRKKMSPKARRWSLYCEIHFCKKRYAWQHNVGPYSVRFISTQTMWLTVWCWSLCCEVQFCTKRYAWHHNVGPYSLRFISTQTMWLTTWCSMRFISTQKMWLTVPVRECLFLSFAVLINNLCPSVVRCWCLYVGSHLF